MLLCVLCKKYSALKEQKKKINLLVFVLLITCIEINAATLDNYDIQTAATDSNNVKSVKQSKRDLSLSYAATNIDSKEGTRVKTITVIKNVGKKHEKLEINPELHKNENWGSAFRDNFDKYGAIPDVPDIDDLFEFMNKKKPLQTSVNENPKTESKSQEKPVKENAKDLNNADVITNSTKNAATTNVAVQKIEGDAELLPRNNNNNNNKQENKEHRSESISGSASNTKQRLIDVNYSTPQHTVSQYFENYIQLPQIKDIGYDYAKPCNNPSNTINIATPSGRTYNVPAQNNRNNSNPYLAPAVTKKPQQPQAQLPLTPSIQLLPAQISIQFPQQINIPANQTNTQNRAPFSINSIVGPVGQTQDTNVVQQQTQGQAQIPNQQPNLPPLSTGTPIAMQTINSNNQANTPNQQSTFSTSQRPYLAPNLRQGLTFSRNPPQHALAMARNRPGNYRPGVGVYVSNRSIFSRSRGLKY